MDLNSPPQTDFFPSRPIAKKPYDIRLELPAFHASMKLPQNLGPSSSKTLYMEMDLIMAKVDYPKSKSVDLCLDYLPGIHPGDRWVKRLKSSSSHSSARGTKSTNQEETPSFSRMITISGPTKRKCGGKETMVSHKGEDLSNVKENEQVLVEPMKKGMESLLSHAWIQRWLCNGSRMAIKKPSKLMVWEPHSLKIALNEDHFPSIEAMALVGKAMRNFQPCELQKMGSFTIWNTKTI